MHKSGLAGFIIDCKTEDLDEAAQFWSQALNLPLQEGSDAGYRKLGQGPASISRSSRSIIPAGSTWILARRMSQEK